MENTSQNTLNCQISKYFKNNGQGSLSPEVPPLASITSSKPLSDITNRGQPPIAEDEDSITHIITLKRQCDQLSKKTSEMKSVCDTSIRTF